MEKILVLFSGGQDSTTLLCWAKKHFPSVHALFISYGQRHTVEEQQAKKIAQKLSVPLKVIPFDLYRNVPVRSSLVNPELLLPESVTTEKTLPNTFVPGRNLFFLALAAVVGYENNIFNIALGANQIDYSGYPDCRGEFLKSMEKTLSLAMQRSFRIHAPLLKLSKKAIWELAEKLGCLELVIHESHTCYAGVRGKRFAWGYGCGKCPACILRKQGFEKAFRANEK